MTADVDWSDRLDLAGHALLGRDGAPSALAELLFQTALALSVAPAADVAAVADALAGEAVNDA